MIQRCCKCIYDPSMVPNVARCQELRRTQMRRSRRLLSQDWRVGWCDPRISNVFRMNMNEQLQVILWELHGASWSYLTRDSRRFFDLFWKLHKNTIYSYIFQVLRSASNMFKVYKMILNGPQCCTVPGALPDTNAKEPQAAEPGLEGSGG